MSATRHTVPVVSDVTVTSLREIAVPAYGPTALASVGTGAVTPILALTALDLGATTETAAVVVALMGVGMVVGDLPAGALAARIGERRALLFAALAEGLGMVGAGLSRSVLALASAVLVMGVAGSVFGLARHAYLTEVVPAGMRARALSTLGGVHRVGIFVGPFLGAAAVSVWDTRAAYAVGVTFAVLAAVLVALTPDLARYEGQRAARHTAAVASAASGVSGAAAAEGGAAREGGGASAVRPASVWSVLRAHRRVLTTLGLGVLAVAAARAARNAIVPLWAESIGLDAASTSLVFGISGAADMLLFYPAGWAMDRFGRVHVAVPSMLVLGVGMALIPVAGSFAGLVLVGLVLGVGNGIGSGILMTLGADASPEQGRAQFLGGWRLMGDLGWAAGPALVSLGAAVLSLGAAAVMMGGLAWLGAAWLRVWVPRYDPTRAGRRPVAAE